MNDSKQIENKWQKYWEDNKVFHAKDFDSKTKYYLLVEFPYPSGAGLHVGHVRSYTALDAMARKKRMQGYNVIFPMGWDAFGAPAEQYAIKNKIHPADAVKENIATFKGQIQSLGISFDWTREISTTDPDYYKWTQWQFIQFFKHGMAYKDKKDINWCPSCKTGLSNEDAAGGVCERCGTKVEQKEKEQWLLKMSEYSEDLLEGLKDTEFSERIKTAQINWIGKSKGAEVKFKIKESNEDLVVFTTRPDTLFGVTFMVIAPESPVIEHHKDIIENFDEVLKYREQAKEKSEFERMQVNKGKTGLKIKGINAINPITNKEIPIYVSDYVMIGYGTGAIMAVPAHDERDYEFAKKYDIPIIEVIKGGNISESAYAGDGIMVNSEFLNGIDNKEEAVEKTLDYLKQNNLGVEKINYKLQDWTFSRQRFWGEPIPLVHCEKCGWVEVPDKDLPVVLPNVAHYEPTDDGESPLAKIEDWVNTICPKCGGHAKRETDTMPNWAGSSWYWLRYMDVHNNKEFASIDKMKYWGQVDWYNGGMEHATRHLLYARFWNQFLYNHKLVAFKEPFKVRAAHGMILGAGGEKMSKSKGNVVNPDDIIKEYGADALRIYEMFIGDYEQDAVWSEQGLRGCFRFVNRIVKLGDKVTKGDNISEDLKVSINQTIKKVTEDIDHLKFNTAVSALMILLNNMDELENINEADYRILLLLLNPIAPHITEELNEKYKLGNNLCLSNWPVYDEKHIVNKTIEIPVQINGKLKSVIIVPTDATNEQIKEVVLSTKEISVALADKTIVKEIYVPKKIYNIIIK